MKTGSKNLFFLLLALLVVFTNVSGQTAKDTLTVAQAATLRKSLEIKDSTIYALTSTSTKLQTNNEILNTSLSANSNIFGGLSVYFTIISILLTIIVIALPVVNYFLVLKPNKEMQERLGRLESEIFTKIEQNFEVYLTGLERKKAKSLINSLTSTENLAAVTNFLFLSQYNDFDDEDQRTVVSFLEKYQDIENADRIIVNYVLRYRPSLIAETYYKRVLEQDRKNDYLEALEYLISNSPENNISFFEMLITASPKGHVILLDIIRCIADKYVGNPLHGGFKPNDKKLIGEQKAKLFLNNEKICEAVKDKPKTKNPSNKSPFNQGFININILNWNPYIRETLYYSKYLTEMDSKNKSTTD